MQTRRGFFAALAACFGGLASVKAKAAPAAQTPKYDPFHYGVEFAQFRDAEILRIDAKFLARYQGARLTGEPIVLPLLRGQR